MDVPSPVQHADGRWLTPTKLKPICEQHNPGPADIWWHVKSERRGLWGCRVCHRESFRTYRAAKREKQGRKPVEEAPKAERITPAHPYDWTRLRLEREWGVPIEQWTQAQHRFHTRAIYHHLGWGDAALEGPMICNGQTLDKPRTVNAKQGMMWKVG